jgi:photosystem II stability/assembly factor-like uncharacterized protein
VTLEQAGDRVEVARTSDGGSTWSTPVTAASFFLGDTPIPRFGVRFANVDDGWLFGQGLYASTDGGITWLATSVDAHVYDVAISGASVWAITDRGLFRSQAGATDWTAMPGAPRTTGFGPVQLIRVSDAIAFIVQEAQFDDALYRTTDGGSSWSKVPIPCSGYSMPIATLDGVHLLMLCGSEPSAGAQGKSTYVSDDGGADWTLRSFNDGTKSTGSIPVSGYVRELVSTGLATAFMGTNRGDLFRSTDGGRTWTAANISQGDSFFSGLQFVDASDGWAAAVTANVALDGRVGLFRTTDGGATWHVVSSTPGTVA